MAKKKRTSEKTFLEPIIPNTTEIEALWASILAHLVIGVNPYLDISTVHVLLMDALTSELDEAMALKVGQNIAKQARISIADDSPGGVH